MTSSVATGATVAPAVDALNNFLIAQVSWDPTYTCRLEIVISRLHTPQTTESLVSRLLPLSNEITVSITLIQAEFKQLLGNFLPAIEKIIHISTLLMSYLEYRPQCFTFPFPIMCIILSFSHICL